MTHPKPLKSPVLFLVFNRPELTYRVFEEIRKVRPPTLYIAADGHRANKPGEKEIVEKIRKTLTASIDWPCQLHTLFREENLGCKVAVSEAITWFFENEEMGIILEDDCLPRQSFFWFCDELLDKYKDDERIGQICGRNKFDTSLPCIGNESYFFSTFSPIWGWASWARAWRKQILSFTDLTDINIHHHKIFEKITFSKTQKRDRLIYYSKIKNDQIDTWDFNWGMTKFLQNQLGIIPSRNLIKNIGFGDGATHTTSYLERYNPESVDIPYPIIHPLYVLPNLPYDKKHAKSLANPRVAKRIQNKINKLIYKFFK
jgi:hypothetical protein